MKYNRYALTLLCGILMFCFGNRASAQVSIVVDTPGCGVFSTTLHGTNLGTSPYATGLTIDDQYSGVIPIGFSFDFYGTSYTQLLIGSNGNLCFDVSLASSYDPWSITSALLGNTNVYNNICGPWCDIYAAFGGTIEYSTIGTAPNRKFIATWCRTAMFSCTSNYVISQIVLYETTNNIEVHCGRKDACTWNSNHAIIGVQNASGTAATAAPGRDFPTSVTISTPEAWRFTPTGSPTSSYTVSTITYSPVPYASSSIMWYDSTTGAYLGTGSSITVSPTIPTTYEGITTGCYDTNHTYLHIDPATFFSAYGDSILNVTTTNPTDCGKPDGTIRLTGHITTGLVDSVFVTRNGIPQPPMFISPAADGSITITGLLAGTYTNIYFHAPGHCPSNPVGPYTLVDPTLTASFTFDYHLGCSADTVMVTNTSTTTALTNLGHTYVFSFGDGTIDSSAYNPVHVYYTQSLGYNISLLYHNAYGCSSTYTLPDPIYHTVSSVFSNASMVCYGVPEVFTNASAATYTPMTYAWTFGDGTTSTDMDPTHVYAAPGTYSVTLTTADAMGCTATSSTTLDVILITTTLNVHDTTVCLRLPMPLNATTTVIPASYTGVSYSWSPTTGLSDPTIADPTFMTIGDYTYTVSATVAPLGCTASDVVHILSNPPVILTNVTADVTIPYGASVQLNADSAWIYTWTPNNGTLSNPNINNPVATPTDSVTTYMVVGMSPYGCRDSAYVTVRVDQGVTEFIPEAFTPNGDGLNDKFRAYNLKYQKLVDFRIFNRWGKEVFHSIDTREGWDGTLNGVPQDMGVYYYQIILAHPDGEQKSITGSVTLIR